MKAKEMSALAVASIKKRGIHFVGGVTGLALNVTKYGSRSWVMRFQIKGKRRDMGLGSYPSVTLAQARESARAAREVLRQGVDPVEHARAARQRLIVEQETAVVFADAATHYIATHEHGWRNAKHAQQWRNTIETYANPVIGKVPLRDIDVAMVRRILEPIWTTKNETASRVRGRIESIIDWGITMGYRSAANPARWKGHLEHLLAQPSKVARRTRQPALPYADMPAFMQALRKQHNTSARALEFLILTGVRSGEVRNATWSEFDLDKAVWTIPAERMKGGREHRVPLSEQALRLVRAQQEVSFCSFVFPSPNRPRDPEADGAALSDMALTAVMRRMALTQKAVPHGFRSTFRDWVSETTTHSNEVAEMALAHSIRNRVEAAYRRGDLFGKRRQLMQEWADFVLRQQPSPNVVPISEGLRLAA
jgi:integrase